MNGDAIRKIKELPLKEMLESKHGLEFNEKDFAKCPFHGGGNESDPSFHLHSKNGECKWRCFACNDEVPGGDYIDFYRKLHGMNLPEALESILAENGLDSGAKKQSAKGTSGMIAAYTYTDKTGKEIYRKCKYSNKEYAYQRRENGTWKNGLDGTARYLYNLPETIASSSVFYLEGEKDCETLKGLGFVATTAGSVNDWRNGFSEYFKDKTVNICLDVGNEDKADAIAYKLAQAAQEVKIIKLPGLNQREQDITDWFDLMGDISNEEKKKKLEKVMEETPIYEPGETISKPKKKTKSSRIVSIRELRAQERPPRDVFLESWLERGSIAIIGGKQKIGKSILSLNIATRLVLGEDFLGFRVPKPRKVLLYQQEISAEQMKERTDKIFGNNDSSPKLDNLFTYTNPPEEIIKITKSQDRARLHEDIEECRPDLVIFDPLSTFHNSNENDEQEMSRVFDCFSKIRNKFKVGVLIIHHIGKPSLAPRNGSHQLRGSSTIGDRADSIIILNELPDQYQKTPLPYSFNCYAELQFTLRNDPAPNNMFTERNPNTLWYSPFNLYGHFGKKITPEKVRDFVKENGGEMLQAELVPVLEKIASNKVAKRAIREAEDKGYIKSVPLPGQGNPNLLKLIQKGEYS